LDVAYTGPAPGVSLAIVLVTCDAGAGTPPSNLLVYDDASSTSNPHIAQTLVRSEDNWSAPRITANNDELSLPVRGYSSSEVPRCCPDVSATLVWRWENGAFAPTSPWPAHYR
jgi:hypothetical protein